MGVDYFIVGAGIYGITLAERIANGLGKRVLIIEKRSHIGGNCYSEVDKTSGIEFHKYGTHIFHTSDKDVWNYLSGFCELNGYYHQVLTMHQGRAYQMPINLETINSFYGRNFKPEEAAVFIGKEIKKAGVKSPKNLEDKAVSFAGRAIYDALIKGYTEKQWGRDPKDLPSDIIKRLPVRFDYNESYFYNSRWQGIPVSGYTGMFKKMLKSPRIEVCLNTDYFTARKLPKISKKIIYTGPIDLLFGYRYGRMGWRSVKFQKDNLKMKDFQGTSVMNYADLDVPYTRIHEPRHLHPERKYPENNTVIFYERSCDDPDDPYYPVNTREDMNMLAKYRRLAGKEKNMIIGGRLGDYSYYDMDMTVRNALECFRRIVR